MKRLLASLTVLTFVVGMLVLPTIHRLHCEESSAHHEADCPVCQLAHAPLDTTDTYVGVPPVSVQTAPTPRFFLTAPTAAAAHDATQPRAPPVA